MSGGETGDEARAEVARLKLSLAGQRSDLARALDELKSRACEIAGAQVEIARLTAVEADLRAALKLTQDGRDTALAISTTLRAERDAARAERDAALAQVEWLPDKVEEAEAEIARLTAEHNEALDEIERQAEENDALALRVAAAKAGLTRIAYLRRAGPTRSKLVEQMERIALDTLNAITAPAVEPALDGGAK